MTSIFRTSLHLLLVLSASPVWSPAADGQLLSPIVNGLARALQRQARAAPVVPEPPPSLARLCREAGHSLCDVLTVRTADGYLLTITHVEPSRPGAVPVLVMHGNFATSDAYLQRKDRQSNFPMVLHRAGYDVWLGNWRGTTHSKRHVSLSSEDSRFYNYSFHEMGMYDVPAFVDLILARTGQPSLHVVGHSMGCPAILVALSTRPEYNAKVRFAALLAPVVWPRGLVQTITNLLFDSYHDAFRDLIKRTNMWGLMPRSPLVHHAADLLCTDDSPFLNLCLGGMEVLFGHSDPKQRIPNFMPTVAATHPAGSSFKLNHHYAVISVTDRFRPFGKGIHDPNPPADYNLTAATAPVGLYYSANDFVMSTQDMERLGRALPNLEESYLVPLKEFNHFDFVWAKDVRTLLYDHLIDTMKKVDKRQEESYFSQFLRGG